MTEKDTTNITGYTGVIAELENAAENGTSSAMYRLGRLYYEGVEAEQDYEKAYNWFLKAAQAGESAALTYLGYCYYYGRAREVDMHKAADCYKQAAKNSDPVACYKLGDMYLNGLNFPEDHDKAYAWYRKAMLLEGSGTPNAANIAARIGHCALYGIGCEKDILEALHLLHRAEEGCLRWLMAGDPYAHLSLPQIREDLAAADAMLKQTLPEANSPVSYPKK